MGGASSGLLTANMLVHGRGSDIDQAVTIDGGETTAITILTFRKRPQRRSADGDEVTAAVETI
jgi:hypothetical protein